MSKKVYIRSTFRNLAHLMEKKIRRARKSTVRRVDGLRVHVWAETDYRPDVSIASEFWPH